MGGVVLGVIIKTSHLIELQKELDLPKEIINGEPKIVVHGKSEIIIENHKGIEVFKENEIKINSNLGVIIIEGTKLEIRFIHMKLLPNRKT